MPARRDTDLDNTVESNVRPDPAAETCSAALAAATKLPSDMYKELTKLDDKLIGVLAKGDIRLVRSAWLLAQPDGFRMPHRQMLEDLDGVSPSPLMLPEEAVELVRRGDRSAGALTYGWSSPGEWGTVQRAATARCCHREPVGFDPCTTQATQTPRARGLESCSAP